MVDASYGGKTGIDFNGIKNQLGTFKGAEAVWIQPTFLQTLNQKVLVSGLAESFKHALIKDASWWSSFKTLTIFEACTSSFIQHSLLIKKNIVDQDPLDINQRQKLNFGHTIGHAIESYSLQTAKPLLHGEAIMLGMLYELRISEKIFGIDDIIRIELALLKQRFFPDLELHFSFNELIPFLLHDKKNSQGIRMSLLSKLGECQIQVPVSIEQIREVCEL